MKKGIKLISILISAALMLNIFPGTVFAAETNQTNLDAPQIGQSQKVKPKVLYEITSKREKNIKEFMTANGTYLAAVYPSAVHYLDNGTWKDIDNSLVSAKDEYNNDILENKANSYKIKIAKSSKANNFVRIQKDKYELSWGIDNQNQVLSSVLDKVKDPEASMDANVQLENINSNVQFKNIYQDIDFQYLIEPEKVKESIVINKNNGNEAFSYNLYVKNLTAKLNDDKSINFYDSSDSSKIVYKMEAPVMYDANGVSGSVDVSITPTDNGYTLSITPDKTYLDSPDRVYPVTIDPPVSTDPGATSIYDSYVSASNPNTNYYLASTLKSGYTSTSGTFRSYVKFDIPDDLTNSSGNLVTQAYFYATATSHTGSSASQVNIHEVTGTWDSTTITWNTKPAYNSSVEDYCMVQSPGTYEWDITRIAKKWLSSGVNNGVMFKDNSETTNYDEYYSSDCDINYKSYRPKVIFYYTNNSGLEDCWTYHSSSAGRAGTGYVNDYNGNLVFVHDDFSLSGNLLPINLQNIYNTNDKSVGHGYGVGWRLNYYQEVAYTNISGNYYYVYTDGDGTKHYFACTDSQNGIYKDESGIGLTLVKNADNTYTITDKGNNKLKFTTSGYLSSITDSNSNTLNIAYTNSRISSITDGAGRVTSFSYNADYTLLQSITEPSTNKVINFEYTGNELTKITDPDGHYSTFTYDADGKMTGAVNYDGYKITYDYYTIKPYRVKTV